MAVNRCFTGFWSEKITRISLDFSGIAIMIPVKTWWTAKWLHVFVNSPSPAVARTVSFKQHLPVKGNLVPMKNVYSMRTFTLMMGFLHFLHRRGHLAERTQEACKLEGNLHLHKVTSSSAEVMQAFPADDLAKDLKGPHWRFSACATWPRLVLDAEVGPVHLSGIERYKTLQ